jgi:hypothetical protein
MRSGIETNLPNESELHLVIHVEDLNVRHLGLDRVNGIGNLVNQKLDGAAGGCKGASRGDHHPIHVRIKVAENVINDIIIGSSSNHELQKRRPEVHDILEMESKFVRQVLEATIGREDVDKFVQLRVAVFPHGDLASLG